jgi:hypothetical protein
MLRRVLVFLALCCGSAATAFAADPLDEVRKSFTIGSGPIPPEIFADFGDAMMSDNRPIIVTIGTNAALDSNRYADPIKTNGRWVKQINRVVQCSPRPIWIGWSNFDALQDCRL